jgi:hypothetical protein
MRTFEGRSHGGGRATAQGHAKMPIAFERGHQLFEVAAPVRGFWKLCQRVFDDLLADLHS